MIENPIPWPNGARCAAAFTFDMDAESLLHIYVGATAHNRPAMASLLRYGPEVAIPRIIDIFQRHNMRQTFFVPAWCLERYPRATRLILDNGHEIGHHGYIHEKPNQLSVEDERRFLRRAIDVIVETTGSRPKGYRAPSAASSRHTLDLLLEEGFEYDSSLMGHDIPYLLTNGTGQLVEIPLDLTMDDWNQYVAIREFGFMMPIASPARAMDVFRAEFESAWRHGGLWMSVWHPFVSGRASRADAMEELIEYMASKGNVWFARCDEIAAHVQACIANGSWSPRLDTLPFYEAPLPDVPAQVGVRAD
jgi:peptidoglycan/xylan/chitin deacetylase (PgdA/CDA1 family)